MQVCAQPGCPTLTTERYCTTHKPPPRPGRKMPTDWRQTRKRIIARDHGTCHWCGRQGATSCDHLIAVSKGGTDDDTNLVCSCIPCNLSKGNRNAPAARERPGAGRNR